MLLVTEESTLNSNKKLVGVRPCLRGCKWHRAVIYSFQMCHAELEWGFSGLTLEGKCYWKVVVALAKKSIQQKFIIRFNFSEAQHSVLQMLGGKRAQKRSLRLQHSSVSTLMLVVLSAAGRHLGEARHKAALLRRCICRGYIDHPNTFPHWLPRTGTCCLQSVPGTRVQQCD